MEHVTVNGAAVARERLLKTWREDLTDAPALRAELAEILFLAAHDLRNPVSAIIASTEMLSEQATSRLEPSERELLTGILNAADVMLNLTEYLLDVAVAGKERLSLSAEDVPEIVAESVAVNRALSKQKRVRLTMHKDARIPPVRVDRMKMLRVMNELLWNAIAVSQPGQSIGVNVGMKGQSVEISVTDAGSGITTRDCERDFPTSPSSGRDAAIPVKRGRALGLAIVRGIVEAHKGHVRVRSGTVGSTYVVCLPLVA
jgi:signal transduction histidine kinase